ncbi:MAG: phenylalanine--tRNA ligase subunit alpha [Chloroflexia bacterium]|nr:phenylalanine--tRNA ligase subunit alpha [Chloroflexia bacterium]
MLEYLRDLGAQARQRLGQVRKLEELGEWKREYLGKKGAVSELLRGLGGLPAEDRPLVGRAANALRAELEAELERREQVLQQEFVQAALRTERVDVTLPGRRPAVGRVHISHRVLRRIYDIFAEMGFQVFDSPEVETDRRNFRSLNIPPHHPARDMWSTFYTTREGVLLRTHTSPGQAWAMQAYCPEPIRVILPGKCYRYEQVTARSEFMFYQVEGLAVGEGITMADLKGVIIAFTRRMFGSERQVRFRCSYFPFTEPSVEVDMDCILCQGQGCRVCKYTGWVEILGAGMVHPVVLRNGGYDPQHFGGFAFGMGPERITMLKYGINDIRWFFSGDLRFLRSL